MRKLATQAPSFTLHAKLAHPASSLPKRYRDRPTTLGLMITAIAALALNAHSDQPKHRRDLDAHEKTTVTGSGATWELAKAACTVPAGALVMSWMQE